MVFAKLFHACAMAVYFFGFWFDQKIKDPPFMQRSKYNIGVLKGRVTYLTFWNLLVQAVFFTVCVVNDLIGTNEDDPKKPPLIRRIKDLILTSLAFPLAFFVGVTFWSIYMIDRELIFPRSLDPFFPTWLNHIMHTNIMIFIFIELYTSCRRYPSRKIGLPILCLFMIAYLIWIHIIHAYTGVWVYPILEVLNLPLRIVFFALSLVLVVGLYIFGEKLNQLTWGSTISKSSSKKRKL